MAPTSPKGDDIVRRGVYALHCLVPDAHGTGGEFYVRGRGEQIDTPQMRAVATKPRATHRTNGTYSSNCASPRLDATATASSRSPSHGRELDRIAQR
jgi:hypothetical protein